jgi:hypothetical protein
MGVRRRLTIVAGIGLVVSAACGGSASPQEATRQAGYDALANARVVEIKQKSTGCEPQSIRAKRGETIRLGIENQTPSEYRLGVADGTNDLIVAANATSSTYYAVPTAGPTLQLRCYIQGGVSTVIAVEVE